MKPTLGLSLLGTLFLVCATSAQEWTVLFDGKPTDKLRGYKQKSFPTNNWVIDGDALKTVPGRAVDLVTTESYKDFELETEWKVQAGGNSGIIYNVVEGSGSGYGATYMTGPEMQVLDDAKHPDGKNPKTSAGSLYAMKAPSAERKVNPAGEWNKAKLIIKNNQVEHWLNGAKIVEYQWGSDEMKGWIAKSKFKDMPHFAKSMSGGLIAFQHHGEEAWYRNIRIRRL